MVELMETNKPEITFQGTLKDYTGEDVTPENFLNILSGKASAMKGIGSGKVIASGPNDHVFVNFVDHGAPGLIAFPDTVLYANQLINTINSMHADNKYAKMVIYLEACEAGSMFEGILNASINVYAATAANADESSYACYYDEKRGTYLGDVFSVNWMQNSDGSNIERETLETQFDDVRNETTTSHVTQYGDLTWTSTDVGQFQGESNGEPSNVSQRQSRKNFFTPLFPSPPSPTRINPRPKPRWCHSTFSKTNSPTPETTTTGKRLKMKSTHSIANGAKLELGFERFSNRFRA